MTAILAPVRSPEYVIPLIDHGAGELYTGLFYPPWEEKFGSCREFNRRGSYGERANPTMDKLEAIVDRANSKGVPVYLTMNALQLSEEQCDFLQPVLRAFADMGGYGVIFSDYALLRRIRLENLKGALSSCAEVRNHLDARFWHEQGCERIVLPRHLTIEEIQRIVSAVPECKYEVFLMNSGCRMIDGFCRGTHNPCVGAMCDFCDKQQTEWLTGDFRHVDKQLSATTELDQSLRMYRHLLRKACGYCAIYALKETVSALKIVGRVAGEEKILRDVALARYNLDTAMVALSWADYQQRMRRPEHAEKRCQNGSSCYYPEMRCGD